MELGGTAGRGEPCKCGKPADHSWTVACRVCGRWFHAKCAGLPEHLRSLVDEMVCVKCANEHSTGSKFREKCRLRGCFQPSSTEYDHFCSPDHREQFWEAALADLPESRRAAELELLTRRCTPNEITAIVKKHRESVQPDPKGDRIAEIYKTAIQNRVETGECGFDPRLIDQDGEVCTNEAKCKLHKNWDHVIPRRLRIRAQTEQERCQPERELLNQAAHELILGTTRFSSKKKQKRAFFIPYVWKFDEDYFLDDDLVPFMEEEYGIFD